MVGIVKVYRHKYIDVPYIRIHDMHTMVFTVDNPIELTDDGSKPFLDLGLKGVALGSGLL